jgi:SPP1 gp7 family putative phage head morphogenesis protein
MADLFDILVRHQIYLEGLKRGRNADFPKVLGKLDVALKTSLAHIRYENLGDANKRELNALLVDLRKAMRLVFDPWLNNLIAWLERYMRVEAGAFAEYFNTEVNAEAIFAATKTEPMGANGLFWFPFLKGSAVYAMTRIERLVTSGYANRLTKDQIAASLLGTKNNRYKDGIGRLLDNASAAAINTVMQHMSAQTSMTAAKKAFGSYEWVSVIDDNTTNICLSRDGQIYVFGRGPVPPAHVGCRSIIVPVYDRAKTPELRFSMWAASQPAAFINDAFDAAPSSRYEGSTAISLDEYERKRPLILS